MFGDLLIAQLVAEELEALLGPEKGKLDRLAMAKEFEVRTARGNEDGGPAARYEIAWRLDLDIIQDEEAALSGEDIFQFGDYLRCVALKLESKQSGEFGGD